MNRLVLAQKVLRTAALAVCVKGRFDAKSRHQAICKAVHLQQVSQFEELLEAKLQDFFNEQLRSIAVELRKQTILDEVPVEDRAKAATKLTKAIFNPKDWDKRLVEATAPTIAVMMVRAALAQQKLMRVDIGKIAKAVKVRGGDTKSISSATAWLFKKLDDADDDSLVGLLMNFGKEGIRLATEIPRWMKTKITELLHESFSEPYWKKINETTATNIENCLARGLTSGQSIRTMANQIQSGLVTEGDTEHYAKVRAKNIAITESGYSLNGSRTTAYDHLKEVLHDKPELTKQIRRVWLSILGPTTRDAHADLDGVPEDDDGLWDLGGTMCRWPSDISLPPEQRCNCRCSTLVQYSMDRDDARTLLAEYEERVIAREQGVYDKSVKVFCPTGEGGGIDPTCSPSSSKGDEDDPIKAVLYKARQGMLGSGINDDIQKTYLDTVARVLGNMPSDKVSRIDDVVVQFRFYGDMHGLAKAANDMREQSGRAEVGVGVVQGMWDGNERRLFLDGNGGALDAEGVYAHEFSHVLDWPNYKISNGDAWKSAWEEEIVNGSVSLSDYATSKPSEGFAEFGRLIYAHQGDSIGPFKDGSDMARELYPKCYAVWKEAGLLR